MTEHLAVIDSQKGTLLPWLLSSVELFVLYHLPVIGRELSRDVAWPGGHVTALHQSQASDIERTILHYCLSSDDGHPYVWRYTNPQ